MWPTICHLINLKYIAQDAKLITNVIGPKTNQYQPLALPPKPEFTSLNFKLNAHAKNNGTIKNNHSIEIVIFISHLQFFLLVGGLPLPYCQLYISHH